MKRAPVYAALFVTHVVAGSWGYSKANEQRDAAALAAPPPQRVVPVARADWSALPCGELKNICHRREKRMKAVGQ